MTTAPAIWPAVKDSPRKNTEQAIPNTGTVNIIIVGVGGLTLASPR